MKDPHAKREAANYDNPIASRELLLEIITKQTEAVNLEQMAKELSYSDENQIEGLRRRLIAMVRDEQILRSGKDGFVSYADSDTDGVAPTTLKDPYAKREASNYDNPIASREMLIKIIADQSAPVNLKHLVAELNYSGENQIEGLRRRLHAMVRDGQIFKNRRDGFMDFSHMDLVKGRVQAHPDGFGFLTPEDGSKDIFLHNKQMDKLLNGDIVAVKIFQFEGRKSRLEGELVQIIQRAHTTVIGRYFSENGMRYVVPDDKRLTGHILVADDAGLEVQDGEIVAIEITQYPRYKHLAAGVLKQVLGEDNAPGMEVTIALNNHDIPHKWNDDVVKEISKFKDKVSTKEAKPRLDLRKKHFVTIDGADARDFDDAVFCEQKESEFVLWVAIADVSHYVKLDSPLDQEATLRGTSVYFPGEVVPMLPEVLSNGLCSLNPHVDRLTMVCEMHIGAQGAIKDYFFHEAVIHSHHRLTYDQAAEIVFENKDQVEGVEDLDVLKPHLEHLKSVYKALQKARKRRKALEFDTKEVYFVFNEERKIESIKQTVRNEAHMLIEECMVSANICAAKFLKKHKVPNLYRNHEGPNSKKIDDLHTFLAMYGLNMHVEKDAIPTTKDYVNILNEIRERPDFELIQTVLLRSMLQATYATDVKVGHFGLSLKDYAHFTSPIRRYPDLLVHRGIRHVLQTGSSKGFYYSLEQMDQLGESCSAYERRADEATRDAADYLKCEFLTKHIGDEFDGKVVAVTSFGLFVQINELLIDGLVHVTSLDRDYYQFDAGKQRLVGENTGKIFHLGDPLRVQVVRVDMQDKKIDFILAGDDAVVDDEPIKKTMKKSAKKSVKKKATEKKSKAKVVKEEVVKEEVVEEPEKIVKSEEPVKTEAISTAKEEPVKTEVVATVKEEPQPKKITAADIYKKKLQSPGEAPPKKAASKKKSAVKTKAEYQAEVFNGLAEAEPEAPVTAVKKKAKKKIKLSKVEKKTKAKKERKDALESAKPKHQKRKNKEKGKPKRIKAKEEGESSSTAKSSNLKAVTKKSVKKAVKKVVKKSVKSEDKK